MENLIKFLSEPLVSSLLTFVGTLLAAWIKREIDLRTARREKEEAVKLQRLELERLTLEAKVKAASTEAVAVTEIKAQKLRSRGYLVTPVAKQAMARELQQAKLAADPTVDETRLGDDTLTFAIEESHAALKEAVRKSETPAAAPDAPMFTAPARSATGFSGDKFQAVHVAAAANPPPIPRPSGEHATDFGEIELPMDDGGEQ
jgi:hypothetical protein